MTSTSDLCITVLFADAFPRLQLHVSNTNVGVIKSLILEHRTETAGQRLRIIYRGTVLDNATDLRDVLRDEENVTLHCSVSERLSVEQLEPSAQLNAAPSGFDRLREAGISEDEIQNLRADFAELHGSTDEVEIRQLEEQWMDEGANDSLGEPPGAYDDILLGTLVGFFGGLLSLIFLRERDIFSKRTQLAVVAGLLINICFSLIRS